MKDNNISNDIFAPRDFLSKYQLPQLVCIHEAHLQQVNETRPRQISRNRLSNTPVHSPNLKRSNGKSTVKPSILCSLANSVQQLPKQYLKKSDQNQLSNCQSSSTQHTSNCSSNCTSSNRLNGHTPNVQSTTNHTPNRVNFQANHQPKTIRNGKSNSDEESKDDEIGEEVFSEELIVDEEDYRNRFNINTLASSDSGNASAASSNCSENQYPSNSSPECNSGKRINKPNNNDLAQSGNSVNESTSIKECRQSNSDVKQEKRLLDLDQPFLLYKSYSSRQVIAHILDVSSAAPESLEHHFQRTGPALLIPESYSGI